jgi:hypothetical protein
MDADAVVAKTASKATSRVSTNGAEQISGPHCALSRQSSSRPLTRAPRLAAPESVQPLARNPNCTLTGLTQHSATKGTTWSPAIAATWGRAESAGQVDVEYLGLRHSFVTSASGWWLFIGPATQDSNALHRLIEEVRLRSTGLPQTGYGVTARCRRRPAVLQISGRRPARRYC